MTRTRSLSIFAMLSLAAFFVTGCGHLYHLRGHNSRNRLNPPDIVMKPGERRKILTEGLSLLALIPATKMIQIQNPSIVRLSPRFSHKAYLAAGRAGSTRVWYSYGKPHQGNLGFTVTVTNDEE